jgi:hypothetical protein
VPSTLSSVTVEGIDWDEDLSKAEREELAWSQLRIEMRRLARHRATMRRRSGKRRWYAPWKRWPIFEEGGTVDDPTLEWVIPQLS